MAKSRALLSAVLGAAVVLGQPAAPGVSQLTVVNDTLMPGASLRIAVGSGVAKYKVTARPYEVWTNFTEGLARADWNFDTVASGPVTSPRWDSTDTSADRPGFLRMSLPSDIAYDCWGNRGNAPFLLRTERLIGSYSIESYVETQPTRATGIAGLVIYDADGYNYNGYRLNYHVNVNDAWISCDFAGNGQTCGTVRIPGGVRRAWLKITYDGACVQE